MGKYINHTSDGKAIPAIGKAGALIADGAKVIPPPTEFMDNLVCVVENGPFDAAAYAYSEQEMKEFKIECGRKKTWLIYEHAQIVAM